MSKNRTAYQGLREIGTKIYYFSKLFANENPMLSVFSCINIWNLSKTPSFSQIPTKASQHVYKCLAKETSKLLAAFKFLHKTLTHIKWQMYSKSVRSSRVLGPVGSGLMYQILQHVFARCARNASETQFSHVSVFSESRNMQKSVTQIIYLGPLPRGQWATVIPQFPLRKKTGVLVWNFRLFQV